MRLDLAMFSWSNARRRRARPGMRASSGQAGAETSTEGLEMFGCPVCESGPVELGLLRWPVGAPTEKRGGVLALVPPDMRRWARPGAAGVGCGDEGGAHSEITLAWHLESGSCIWTAEGRWWPVSDPNLNQRKWVAEFVIRPRTRPVLAPQCRPCPTFPSKGRFAPGFKQVGFGPRKQRHLAFQTL